MSAETGDKEDTENRIQCSYELKRQADEELKSNNYEKANKNYNDAIMQIKTLKLKKAIEEDKLSSLMKEIVIPANMNMSYIALKECKWDDVINYSTKVLNSDITNTKARYRRCVAYINKRLFNDAEDDLNTLKNELTGALELKTLELLLAEKRLEKVDEKDAIYKKMMRHLNKANKSIDYENKGRIGKKIADVQNYIGSILSLIKDAICCRCFRKKQNKIKV